MFRRVVHVGPRCSYKPTIILQSKADLARLYSSGSGGRNLSARGDFLTQLVRVRNNLDDSASKRLQTVTNEGLLRPDHDVVTQVSNAAVTATLKKTHGVEVFRGMVIPEKPKPPGPDDCCMSGCAICVYDLYITSLETYRDALKSIRSTLKLQNIPTSEWPDQLQEFKVGHQMDPGRRQDQESELDVSLSAFAELEKSLRLKKESESK